MVVLIVCARNDLGVPPLDGTQGHDLAPRSAFTAGLLDRSALAYAAARLVHRREVRTSREQGGPPQFLPPDAVAALPPAERALVFEQARARLGLFRDAALAAGAKPVLAVCPDRAILDQPALRAAAFEPVLALGAGLGLPTLDLTPCVQGPDGLREKDGVHPTPAGAERIAAALRALLAERGLLGSSGS
jgi:lysophospholipase L1-like esterase